MRWRIPLVAVLALFVAVSCDQQPVEPMDDLTAAPAFNYMNNDGLFANGKIFRHGHNFGWVGWDVERQLIGWFGTFDPADPAVSFCGLGQEMEQIAAQHLYNNPDLADEIEHLFLQGDVWVELADWTGLWAPFDCDNWASADFLASGEMRIVWTDNDVNAWLGGHPRNNSYGFNGSGRLTLEGGGNTNINYIFHSTWNSATGIDHTIEKLNISRDPR